MGMNELQITQFSIDTCGDTIIWTDNNTNILYVNNMACKCLGYSRDELLCMKLEEIGLASEKVSRYRQGLFPWPKYMTP